MNTELHVVFGAGQVGFPLAERLLAAGKRVRVAKRSSGHLPAGCETALGDAADPSFCAEAARGAAAVYHCMNPPYDARLRNRLGYGAHRLRHQRRSAAPRSQVHRPRLPPLDLLAGQPRQRRRQHEAPSGLPDGVLNALTAPTGAAGSTRPIDGSDPLYGPDPLNPENHWPNSVENQENVRTYVKVMVRNNILSVENVRGGTCGTERRG